MTVPTRLRRNNFYVVSHRPEDWLVCLWGSFCFIKDSVKAKKIIKNMNIGDIIFFWSGKPFFKDVFYRRGIIGYGVVSAEPELKNRRLFLEEYLAGKMFPGYIIGIDVRFVFYKDFKKESKGKIISKRVSELKYLVSLLSSRVMGYRILKDSCGFRCGLIKPNGSLSKIAGADGIRLIELLDVSVFR